MSDAAPTEQLIDALARNMIKQKLGLLENYPPSVIAHATKAYRPFLKAYLDIMRLKGPLTIDAKAPEIRIDESVVDEMRHFFSDYQHLTKAYLRMDNLIGKLALTSRNSEPHLFQQIIDEIHMPDRKDGIMEGVIE